GARAPGHAGDPAVVALVLLGRHVVVGVVAAEGEHDEVRAAARVLPSEVRRVVAKHAAAARADHAEGVVDDAGALALHHHAVEAAFAAADGAEVEPVRAIGHLDDVPVVLHRLPFGVDRHALAPVDAQLDAPAALVPLEPELEARDARADRAVVGRLEARRAARGGAILNAAVSVLTIAQTGADELDQSPLVVAAVPHVLVAVGHRAAGDQQEAVARVAEALLKAPPQRARDSVAGDRRV